MGRELTGEATTAVKRPDPLGENKQCWMRQWQRRRGGEAKRLPEGFRRVLAALTLQGYGISPRPSKWLQLGSTHTSEMLFLSLGAQKTRSPAGERMTLALAVLSPPILLLRVSGITEQSQTWPGRWRDRGYPLNLRGSAYPRGQLSSQLPSITPMAFIPASCSCLCCSPSVCCSKRFVILGETLPQGVPGP